MAGLDARDVAVRARRWTEAAAAHAAAHRTGPAGRAASGARTTRASCVVPPRRDVVRGRAAATGRCGGVVIMRLGCVAGVEWADAPVCSRSYPPLATRGSALDDEEVPRRLVKHDRPVRAAHGDVLDPRAVPSLEVDPGLHAERHAGL